MITMEAIKKMQTVKNGQVLLSLPERFWGQEVEIIIMAASPKKQQVSQKKSMRGCLQQYADPSSVEKEKTAWSDAVKEKYGNN